MKQKFAKFMYGRYGMDELSRALSFASLPLLLISVFLRREAKGLVLLLVLVSLVFSYYRIFSKNFSKRREENAKYLRLKAKAADRWRLRRDMWRQRHEYRFFKCPSCRAVLRVPKGKGKIRIVCKKCGTAFEKKS